MFSTLHHFLVFFFIHFFPFSFSTSKFCRFANLLSTFARVPPHRRILLAARREHVTGSASRDMRGSVRYDVNTWSRRRHQCTAAGIRADNKGKRLLPAILSRQRVGAAFQCIWQSYFLARHSQLFLVNFPIVWLAASCGHLPLSGNQLSARGLRTERERERNLIHPATLEVLHKKPLRQFINMTAGIGLEEGIGGGE